VNVSLSSLAQVDAKRRYRARALPLLHAASPHSELRPPELVVGAVFRALHACSGTMVSHAQLTLNATTIPEALLMMCESLKDVPATCAASHAK
jgi:hypothetical protein